MSVFMINDVDNEVQVSNKDLIINYLKVILVFSHNHNTFDKREMLKLLHMS